MFEENKQVYITPNLITDAEKCITRKEYTYILGKKFVEFLERIDGENVFIDFSGGTHELLRLLPEKFTKVRILLSYTSIVILDTIFLPSHLTDLEIEFVIFETAMSKQREHIDKFIEKLPVSLVNLKFLIKWPNIFLSNIFLDNLPPMLETITFETNETIDLETKKSVFEKLRKNIAMTDSLEKITVIENDTRKIYTIYSKS